MQGTNPLALAAALLAVALGGCDDGPSTTPVIDLGPIKESAFTAVRAAGPVPVEVVGDPFRDPATPAAAVAAMSGALTAPEVAFRAVPAGTPRPEFRTVLALQPRVGTAAERLCAGQGATVPLEGRRLRIDLVFCHRERMLAHVMGEAKTERAGDERFRRLIAQATREMFGPPRETDR